MSESSEGIIKNRLFKKTPTVSLRSSEESIKVVILNSKGFEFNGKKNSDINIKCSRNDVIKIIHQDNTSECHLGMPKFEGSSYVLVSTSAPSPGSTNYGFTDRVLIVDGFESPNIAVGIDSEAIFVCLDHDIEISVMSIDGSAIPLAEVASPEFAHSARCWSFKPYGLQIGNVLRYGINGKNNSGGSLLICESSKKYSIPWWKINSAIPMENGWRIGIGKNITFTSSTRSDSNMRVPSESGSVLSVNGFEQPRLLASCGDIASVHGFDNDSKLGFPIISQNMSNSLNLSSSAVDVAFSCGNSYLDPYEPYAGNYHNFSGKQLQYYSEKDKACGEFIFVKEGGWDIADLIHIRSSSSGYSEKIQMAETGSFVIAASEFGMSGFFFHVQVGENKVISPVREDIFSSDILSRISEKNINVYAKSESVKSDVKKFKTVTFPNSIVESKNINTVYRDAVNFLENAVHSNRMIANDILLINFETDIKTSIFSIINKSINDVSSIYKIKPVFNHGVKPINVKNLIAAAGGIFYIDASSSMVSSYSVAEMKNNYILLSASDSDISNKIKEILTLGVKEILIDGSAAMFSKSVFDINSFITPSAGKSAKYHCSRVTPKTEKCSILELSKKIGNEYVYDPIYDTQYAPVEIFSKVNDMSMKGSSTVFLMPNGRWKFPQAKLSNWRYDEDILKSIADATTKIKDDYDVSIGIVVFVKSAQENIKELIDLCSKLFVVKVLLLDAIYLDDAELVDMIKRFSSNNIEIYLEGHPRFSLDGLLSYSYCSAKWVWSVSNRGKMPDYLVGLVEAI